MLNIAKMLASSTPAANPGLPAHNLGYQAVDVPRPRQEVPMTPMVAEYLVTWFERLSNRYAHHLLSNTRVDRSK